MKSIVGAMTLLLSLAAFTALVPAQAEERPASRSICRPGYALVAGVCVSDRSGDVELPAKK